jgi:hypothetical protein
MLPFGLVLDVDGNVDGGTVQAGSYLQATINRLAVDAKQSECLMHDGCCRSLIPVQVLRRDDRFKWFTVPPVQVIEWTSAVVCNQFGKQLFVSLHVDFLVRKRPARRKESKRLAGRGSEQEGSKGSDTVESVGPPFGLGFGLTLATQKRFQIRLTNPVGLTHLQSDQPSPDP